MNIRKWKKYYKKSNKKHINYLREIYPEPDHKVFGVIEKYKKCSRKFRILPHNHTLLENIRSGWISYKQKAFI